jgi:hypothetical protein
LRKSLTLLAALWFGHAGVLYAWGPLLHQDINRAAAEWVPDEMAGWRAYADLLSRHSNNPDIWRGFDGGEAPRHYMDLELYGDPATVNLTRNRDECAILPDREVPVEAGIALWTMAELQERLVTEMAAGRWEEAVRVAAAQGHYVADTHQPLHCSENHDGQYTGNRGIHRRWEELMPTNFWNINLMVRRPVEVVADPWSTMVEWIRHSNAQIDALFAADRAAKAASDWDLRSFTYFETLWNQTRDLFIDQGSRGAAALASLWYTAWIEAGRPDIPPPPESISSESIFEVVPKPPRGTTTIEPTP